MPIPNADIVKPYYQLIGTSQMSLFQSLIYPDIVILYNPHDCSFRTYLLVDHHKAS